MEVLSLPVALAQETPEPEEHSLVKAAQANPQAFALLYDRYVVRVYRYLLHRLGRELEAEDLTSQVFLDAFRSLPSFSGKMPFGAWLFTIARRRVADYYRSLPPTVPLDPLLDLPASELDPLKQVIETERVVQLEKQMAQLGERDQELLRLRYSADLTFPEMAILLGQKEDAVKKSLYRLLDRLGNQMEANND